MTTTTTTTSTSPISISTFSSSNHRHSRHRSSIAVSVPVPVPVPVRVSQAKSSIHLFSSSPISDARGQRRQSLICCEVALKPEAASSSTPEFEKEDEEMRKAKIGARVRVKVPQLKVYHVPKVPELDIAGMEGELKQYVCLWKGKRISANFPFKVEFFTEVEGRGRVKFFAHLKEDEFEYVQ